MPNQMTFEIRIDGNTHTLYANERLVVNGQAYTLTVSPALNGKEYKNKEWLSEHYHVKNMTQQEIADLFGVTVMTINQWLRKLNIPTRPRGRRQ
jgi:DNA-binding CsgD family transcriptional regulator